eukprot:TRINITY_DN42754_c0_g1_i2.p1 TRINITY_DN42754_c0_g1~~TRINITY_DN42754_c0_g1_i2.p1  ORF type:complete len:111 (+),score=15.60 TRINITY_DN42754_c0_g1_i2:48-335(+)
MACGTPRKFLPPYEHLKITYPGAYEALMKSTRYREGMKDPRIRSYKDKKGKSEEMPALPGLDAGSKSGSERRSSHRHREGHRFQECGESGPRPGG